MGANTIIPYTRHSVSDADVEAVTRALRSDWLTQGPLVEEFEAKFTAKVGAGRAVAVSSGTAALHAAMFAIGVASGDEVIVPAITFVATANAVVYQGGTPIFADVQPDTLLIDTQDVRRKITGATKAVIAVDFAGQPCDYEGLMALLNGRGIWLVGDSCHSLGASFEAKPHASVYSFHATKAITTGEGGMVATFRPSGGFLVDRLRRFRDHGRRRGVMLDLGHNYRLSDIACALGISQLDRLDAFIARRRQIAKRYDEAFAELSIEPLKQLPDRTNARHLYVLKVKGRDAFRQALTKEGIGTQLHYEPVHLQPYYRQLGYKEGECPNAEKVAEEIVSIPLYPGMANGDVERVIRAVGRAA